MSAWYVCLLRLLCSVDLTANKKAAAYDPITRHNGGCAGRRFERAAALPVCRPVVGPGVRAPRFGKETGAPETLVTRSVPVQ